MEKRTLPRSEWLLEIRKSKKMADPNGGGASFLMLAG